MSSKKGKFKPLLAVGLQYVQEAMPSITSERLGKIKEHLDNFIDGKIGYNVAERRFLQLIGTTIPLEKINKILLMDDKPIPLTYIKTKQNFLPEKCLSGNRKRIHQWTEYEDQRLLAGIHQYGLENWPLVSDFVGNGLTRAQCAQRWYRGLDPHISKFIWTKEEDEKLLESIKVHGDRSWTRVASDVGTRSDAQCRYRYKQITQHAKNVYPEVTVQKTILQPDTNAETPQTPLPIITPEAKVKTTPVPIKPPLEVASIPPLFVPLDTPMEATVKPPYLPTKTAAPQQFMPLKSPSKVIALPQTFISMKAPTADLQNQFMPVIPSHPFVPMNARGDTANVQQIFNNTGNIPVIQRSQMKIPPINSLLNEMKMLPSHMQFNLLL